MKRELTFLLTAVLTMAVLLIPLSGMTTASANVTPTTTKPLETTTTGWDCCSTNTTYPPTTTSWTPETTTLPPTTTPPKEVCGDVNDILSYADIDVSETMALLGHPAGGNWLSADCYSYDGGTITITPNDAYLNDGYDYLHLTITANVPFTVVMDVSGCFSNPMMWFPEDAMQEDGYIAKGAYVLSGDVSSAWSDRNPIKQFVVYLSAPGSVTVGHLALSTEAICGESAPRIQTTTRPSFPWDETTTLPPTTTTTWVLTGPDGTNPDNTTFPTTTSTFVYTTFPTTTTTVIHTTGYTTQPTTNPTVGDALVPGDADGDGFVTSSDARVILSYCLEGKDSFGKLELILVDFNGDGAVSTADVRAILAMLTA